MTKFLIILLTWGLALSSCGQTPKEIVMGGVIIDPAIADKVEDNISVSPFTGKLGNILVYNNRIMADLYEDDSLKISTENKNTPPGPFKSFYYWQGDTLSIDGTFGIPIGFGFSIKIVNGTATVYHLLSSDVEFPSYSLTASDELEYRIEVPCTNTKIILSESPISIKDQIVYGYVEFKSGEYYTLRGSEGGREFLPRLKQRSDMKIYFKSAKFPQ